MDSIKKYMSIVEARMQHPEVDYLDDPTKVTALLRGHKSAELTILANKLQLAEELASQLEEVRSEIKQHTREQFATLFDVEDATKTRLAETVSCFVSMTKDPKDRETVQWAEVVKEMMVMAPQLVEVMAALKQKYTKLSSVQPSITYKMKEDSTDDPLGIDTLVAKIQRWLPKYDAKLASVENKLQ